MHWDPLHDLVVLRERATRRPSQPDAAWAPSVDLLETDAAFFVVAELPGLARTDFDVSATADGVVLAGTRPAMTPPPERYLRMERGHGRFQRTFTFTHPIDVAGIQATFDRGLLTVVLTKTRAAANHRIAIG